MKFNYMKMDNGMMRWKQIEKKDGMTFMRMKRRSVRCYKLA